jgi:hypothetical protein
MSGPDKLTTVIAAGLLLTLPSHAFAYVGPGAGLGVIGSLIAVIIAVVVTVLGIIILPVRLLMRRRKSKIAAPTTSPTESERN